MTYLTLDCLYNKSFQLVDMEAKMLIKKLQNKIFLNLSFFLDLFHLKSLNNKILMLSLF